MGIFSLAEPVAPAKLGLSLLSCQTCQTPGPLRMGRSGIPLIHARAPIKNVGQGLSTSIGVNTERNYQVFQSNMYM